MDPEILVRPPVTLESFGRHQRRAYRHGDLIAQFELSCDAYLFAAAEEMRDTLTQLMYEYRCGGISMQTIAQADAAVRKANGA